MIKKYCCLIFLVLFLVSFKNPQNVTIFLGENNFAAFAINNEKLNQTIQIAGNKEFGGVFFETKKGKNWLKGKPVKVSNAGANTEGKWQIDGRQILISFRKVSDQYEFAFKAIPDTGILKWGINIVAANDEYFTGLFERVIDGEQNKSWAKGVTGAMNLRGQQVDMLVKPTTALYSPFYLSSKGYGLFVNGYLPGHYDICKTDPNIVMIEFEGHAFSGIIYTSDNPANIVKTHSLHVGPTIVPPKWAFLPWRWRDDHYNLKTYYDSTTVNAPFNSQVVEDIEMMKALDIPCGVYWVDRPWAKGRLGYDDFDWDPERFPNAEKMIQWLHKNNTKFILWIGPWVAGKMKQEAERKGFTQPIKARPPLDSTNAASLDFTNPEACKWWQETGIEKMLKEGVDGFKLDRSEEELPEYTKFVTHDGRTIHEVRNEYPVLYVKTVNESCRKILGDDFMLIPRAAYTGSSKYSGFWAGDIGVPQEGLRAAIISAQRNAVNGYPIWGSDIGGYGHAKVDREISARWLAFGCFSPIMEFGPFNNRGPWDMATPPAYDTALLATWRLYAKVHTAMASYSYNLAKEAHETGMPIIRPLFLVYPDQLEAWTDWQTFMYGPDILISAIWEKGSVSHTCYLPKGTKWRDAWDGKVYEGGQTVSITTPFQKIPIFLRENSTFNLGDLNKLYQESLEIVQQKPDLKELEKKEHFE